MFHVHYITWFVKHKRGSRQQELKSEKQKKGSSEEINIILKKIALLQVHLPKNCSGGDDYELKTDNNASYVILSSRTVFFAVNNILICKECKKRVQFIDKNYSDKKKYRSRF